MQHAPVVQHKCVARVQKHLFDWLSAGKIVLNIAEDRLSVLVRRLEVDAVPPYELVLRFGRNPADREQLKGPLDWSSGPSQTPRQYA